MKRVRTLDDLDHGELAVLVREYLLAGQLIDRAGMPHVISAFGREQMGEVAIGEWMGASPIYSRRMQKLLDFEGSDVATIFKGMQFDIGAPPEFMDFRYKVIDANHGEFWLDHCGALMDVEPLGDDYVHTMCHTIEDPTFDATAAATNPRARIRPIHRPPRVPADRHPHCHWTVEISEDHDPLPYPEAAEVVGRSRLAGLPLATIPAPAGAEANGAAGSSAEPEGWMADYAGAMDPDLRTEMFTSEALRVLADEICVQSHLLVMSFVLAIESLSSTEVALDIAAKQFIGSAGLTSERIRTGLGLGTELVDIATVLELHPAFRPRNYVDFEVELDEGANSLTLHLRDCLALGESGLDSWISILSESGGPTGGTGSGNSKADPESGRPVSGSAAILAAAQGVNPAAVVNPVEAQTGDVLTWQVEIGDVVAETQTEVTLARFSSGAEFEFAATPVELSRR